MFQEPAFTPETTGIAGERAIAANYAVTGHNDGQFIFTIGSAYCADAFGIMDPAGELLVRNGLSEWNNS